MSDTILSASQEASMIYNNGQDEAKWLQEKPVRDVFANTVSRPQFGTIQDAEIVGVKVPAGRVFVGKQS
jgi:hypothetical protein